MDEEWRSKAISEQVEFFTRSLVGIKSVNGTDGEALIADSLKEILSSFPYFKENPNHLWEQCLPNDELGRKNIFALVKASKPTKQTVIWHSHIDTVGIGDFGVLKNEATNPEVLAAFFSKYEFDKDVYRDARSGDWLFGRGAVDMKSGAAVHLANLLYFTDHLDELQGNILLMFNPDEESQHKGVRTAIKELKRLKDEHQIEFVVAINNDFITPLYDGDTHRYIYTGAAGKILPCFYIYGREAHVGDSLSGVDPNFIAAELTRRIHNNIELTEDIEGELVLPPSCLCQRDTKTAYNVQTATSSYLYFNYFLYRLTAKDVMDRLQRIAKEACRDVEKYFQEQYRGFLQKTGLPAKSLSWDIEVISLEGFIGQLEGKGIRIEERLEAVRQQYVDLEPRMLCFKLVESLQELDPDKRPRVILFFAPPYLPHNYLDDGKVRDRKLLDAIIEVLAEAEQETGEKFALKKFFPYLADGSFLSLHETDEEVGSLLRNFPEWEIIYPLPVQEIRELNIPSINLGVYGKDGHKWTERVFKPYTFTVLPRLIRKTTQKMFHSLG
jgi:arginine utilization protein RocB